MEQNIYFNNRIGQHLRLTQFLLIIVLFAAIAQFASFGLIQAHVISFYGAQPEDVSFAFQIAYVGIIATLPVQFRLVRYFNTRNYLFAAFFTGILLNIGCLFVDDLILFSILRFLIGVVTCMIAGCMLIVIFTTLPEAKRMLVGISLFFSLILTCGLIIGIGAAWVVSRMDWVAMYYGLIGLQVIAIAICLYIFRPFPIRKPYPLHQIDWTGAILFMFAALAVAFVMIYGPKRLWMDDPTIRYASLFAMIMLGLFLFRQLTVKRPLVFLNVFKSGKFLFALLLMLLFFGIKDSINLLYGYSAVILGWSSGDVVNAGLFNIAGVIIATFISVKVVLLKKQNLPKLLLVGFAVMFFYHWWVYVYITSDLSFSQLVIPIFLHGIACGLLFVPITIFSMASVSQNTGMTGIVIVTYTRFIAVLNSIAGFYTLQLNYNQKFKENFLGKLAPENENFLQRMELYKGLLQSKGYNQGEATGIANMLIAKSSGIQSQLLTIRAIFLTAAYLMAITFCIIIVFAIINRAGTSRSNNTAGKPVAMS